MRNHYYLVTGVPPGLAKEDRHAAQTAWQNGVGKQSASQPADITSVRPNKATVFDDEGNIVNDNDVATAWIIAGDMSGESWETDEDAHNAIAQALGDYLQAPAAPIVATVEVMELTHAQVLNELSSNAAFWGEL